MGGAPTHFLREKPGRRGWFTVLFAYVVLFFWLVLWLGIYVEVDVDRITILPPPPPSPFLFFSLPTILSFTQVTVISLKSAGA